MPAGTDADALLLLPVLAALFLLLNRMVLLYLGFYLDSCCYCNGFSLGEGCEPF